MADRSLGVRTPQHRWTLGGAARLAPSILARLPRVDGFAAPATWIVQRAVRTSTGMALWAGPSDGPAVVVLKLAPSGDAAPGLERETAALASLRQLPELQEWRAWLPVVIADGEVDGLHFRAERAMDGVAASSLVSSPDALWQAMGAAAASIRQLHERTAMNVTVDARLLQRWVGQPLAELRATRLLSLWPGARRGLDRLEQFLREAFAGQSLEVSWVHGDFWAGNILVTPEGERLVGIIDWDMAGPGELPARDMLHLLLYGRRLVRGVELGDSVRALLGGAGFTAKERNILESAGLALPACLAERREWIGEYWLRHVADHLRQDRRHQWNGWWIFRNVYRVLQCF